MVSAVVLTLFLFENHDTVPKQLLSPCAYRAAGVPGALTQATGKHWP
jgi:hypothetical protein